MMGEKCPWFYNQHTTDLKDAKHLYYFTHIFLVGTAMSEFFSFMETRYSQIRV